MLREKRVDKAIELARIQMSLSLYQTVLTAGFSIVSIFVVFVAMMVALDIAGLESVEYQFLALGVFAVAMMFALLAFAVLLMVRIRRELDGLYDKIQTGQT